MKRLLPTGLSQSSGHTAMVSAVFLCPQSGTRHLSGAGVVGGNTTAARAVNTATGPDARENPGIGLDANSSKRLVMKSNNKKKGAACPKTVTVRVRLDADVAEKLLALELKEAAFEIPENARTLSESLNWLAMQAARDGDVNPCLLRQKLSNARKIMRAALAY